MNSKNALTISLLLFVVASIAVLAFKGLRVSNNATTHDDISVNMPIPKVEDGVMVFYFHGNVRCPTCRKIEEYTQEAVESQFSNQLKKKEILWQIVNYETPGNEHFATDYKLIAPTVVLAIFKNGDEVKWKSLPEVWEHVGDKPFFMSFVQKSLNDFIQDKEVTQ
jgi:hypothetical protein